MFRLTTIDLLRIWETGERQSQVERALTILAAACPDQAFEQLLDMSLGQRDRLLLLVRQWLFGPELKGFAECPPCGQRLEFMLSIPRICGVGAAGTTSREHAFSAAGFDLRFRSLRSRDLLNVAPDSDTQQARLLLAKCCLQDVHRDGQSVSVDDLPEVVLQHLAIQVVESEPLQEIQLDMTCPACDHRWQPLLDIGQFLWEEVAAYARRLLREVHILAQAYGWHEDEILALSARRRQAYLEMVRT
jgi:hypothetical protein